jgi:hypothetical protein
MLSASGQRGRDGRGRRGMRTCVHGAVKTGRRRLTGGPWLQCSAAWAEREPTTDAWSLATVTGFEFPQTHQMFSKFKI